MAVSSVFARGLLRHVYSTVTHGATLLDKLNSLNNEAVHALESGKILQQTTGNGRSVTFQVNGAEGVTPTDMAEAFSRLLDLYDDAVTAGNATDANRFGYMMGRLKPVRAFRNDFSNLMR